MLIGTAGHIDHGKTALVKSLTGWYCARRKPNSSTASAAFYVPPAPEAIQPPEEPASAGWVSGVIYDDWDSDGYQQPDELVFRMPFTLTLGAEQMETMGGRGFFLGLPGGAYTLEATTTAVQPQSFTLTAQEGHGFGLAAVAPGMVRGIISIKRNL